MLPETFQTDRLALRPISQNEAEPIFNSYGQDPEASRYTTWTPHKDLAETREFIAGCLSTPPETGRTYAIFGKSDGLFRGLFGVRHPKPFHVDVGYVLARRWWRQGFTSEVLTRAVDLVFAQDAYFRVSGVCDVDNIGSARVMEKAGLTREGVLRRWLIHPNISHQPHDCLSYAKVR